MSITRKAQLQGDFVLRLTIRGDPPSLAAVPPLPPTTLGSKTWATNVARGPGDFSEPGPSPPIPTPASRPRAGASAQLTSVFRQHRPGLTFLPVRLSKDFPLELPALVSGDSADGRLFAPIAEVEAEGAESYTGASQCNAPSGEWAGNGG